MTASDSRAPAPEPPPSVWSGRDDGPGPEHHRWHHVVDTGDKPRTENHDRSARDPGTDLPAEVALLGFASDEGVRRNHGRVGAAAGPDALRSALAPLAVHADVTAYDAGDVTVDDGDLEAGQERLGDRVTDLLDTHRLVVVLGGGHETAYGSYRGLAGAERLAGSARLGILNLDAHFDLRAADRPSSGTPFRQIAADERAAGRPLRYRVAGISRPNNTRALFETADDLGVRYLTDEDCLDDPDRARDLVDELVDSVDIVHLSVDLDVLPAATAPGVSAPAGLGVPLPLIHGICRRVAASGKLALLDIVELSPPHDSDSRTARAAARLITTAVHTALDEEW